MLRGGPHGQKCIFLTSSTKDNSVPGDKQTATFLSSDAAKPRVLPEISDSQVVIDPRWSRLRGMEAVVAHLLLPTCPHPDASLCFSELVCIRLDAEPEERWGVIG